MGKKNNDYSDLIEIVRKYEDPKQNTVELMQLDDLIREYGKRIKLAEKQGSWRSCGKIINYVSVLKYLLILKGEIKRSGHEELAE